MMFTETGMKCGHIKTAIRKTQKFHLMSGVEILWKCVGRNSVRFHKISHTKKLGKIPLFYAVQPVLPMTFTKFMMSFNSSTTEIPII